MSLDIPRYLQQAVTQAEQQNDERLLAGLKLLSDGLVKTLQDLHEYCAIPSISSRAESRPDMERAAAWAARYFQETGPFRAGVFPTAGHPVVLAEYSASPGRPSLLIYGHYDVQPAGDMNRWERDPFQGAVQGDYFYARGAADMKGQIMACAAAASVFLARVTPSFNIIFLLEGEEEIGSPNLAPFVTAQRERLACGCILNPDAGMIGIDLPTITYALRGAAIADLTVFGPAENLHSGGFGGTVHNPAQALCEVLAGLHDARGRVTVPGFYDQVLPLEEEERRELARLPTDERYFLESSGAPALWGEPEYSPAERTGARPTLEINGIHSGYSADGIGMIIPSQAKARISMRLVPWQDPETVYKQLETCLASRMPPAIRHKLEYRGGILASLTRRDSVFIQAMHRSLELVWGKAPLYSRTGGGIPAVAIFQTLLGADSVLAGFSCISNDNVHGPNERLHLPTWCRGSAAVLAFFHELDRLWQGGKN